MRQTMKTKCLILITVFLNVLGVREVTAQAEECKTECFCCASASDGSRNLGIICGGTSDTRCKIGCKDGYFGGKCYNRCPAYCTRCAREFGASRNNDYRKCYLCADGYYNDTGVTDCSTPCPVNCANNQCDKNTGRCLSGCVSNIWSGDKCDQCATGFYGQNCDPCPEYCKDNQCRAADGTCTNGCKDAQFTGDKCDKCQTGRYGQNCEETCPENCKNDICDRQDGTCTNGCKANFDGSKCEECMASRYGEMCDKTCSNCDKGQCDRISGLCDSCSNGFYGQYCNVTCSGGCRSQQCDRYNATCTRGCWTGYSGDKCCVNNNNCVLCDTTSSCSQCKTGKFGDSCGQSCPSNCADKCDKKSGNCASCKISFHGNKCTESCHKNCFQSNCAQQSGQCNSCKIGFHGNDCNHTCPENCLDHRCNQDGGECDNCTVGYHGLSCDLNCTPSCVNASCAQMTGVCTYGCETGNPEGSSCIIQSSSEQTPSPVGGAVGGAIGGLVVIAVVVLGIWFYRRRRSQQKNKETSSVFTPALPTEDGDQSIYVNEGVNINESRNESDPKRKKATFANEVHLHEELDVVEPEPEVQVDSDYYTFSNRINIVDLYHYVTSKPRSYFSDEFHKLPKSLTRPCTVARKSENIAKNRYNGIYPYDHSRVTIAEDKTFFINACYINGFKKDKAYIASLGPTEATTDNYASFWKMVWHEKSDVIVMLTNLREATGMKCEQYWPDLGKTLTFPRLELSCDSIEEFSAYTVRSFSLKKGTDRRVINQLHFTAWPDKGVPDDVTCMIEFRQRVKSTSTLSTGPVIVHCSAGVGRTGTYIAIDLLTEEGESDGSVDVFDCVRKLREQRVNMVQTSDQYMYVHRAVIHTLTFYCDNIPAETFHEHVLSMTESLYHSTFKKLKTVIDEEDVDNKKSVSANASFTEKNRTGSDIPGDHHRPRLFLNRGFNESSYINAVYVDGFKKKNHFLLAQTPLPTTVTDFLCLAFQDNCSCIVSLEDLDCIREDVGIYIPPDNQILTGGSFNVSSIKCETNYCYEMRKLTIENTGKQSSGTKTIFHYQYKNWKRGQSTPSDALDFAQFVQNVTSQCSKTDQELSPLLVHCLTGGEKGGLFCTVSLLLEKADSSRQISVTNTIRQIRLRRPNVIPNKEQFQFCHECVAAQMEMLCTYTNANM